MTRLGMVIDTTKCIGCDACFIACKDEYVGNIFPGYSAAQPQTQYGYYPGATPIDGGAANAKAWVINGQNWIVRTEVIRGTFPNVKQTTYPMLCLHCDACPLVANTPNGATYKRPDGIVIIDPDKAFGQTKLPSQCPYNEVFWNSASNIAQKCTMCAHLVDQGKNPKCVDVCPRSVFTFGDLDDPNSAVSKLVSQAQPLHPEYNTKPKITFIGYPKTFIMGKVVDSTTGAYLKDASVVADDFLGHKFTTTVDNYGDFTLDGLDKGNYALTVSKYGYKDWTQTIQLNTDTYVGDVKLGQ